MRWAPGDRSNIEDARGRSGGRVATMGIGGFLVVLALRNQLVLVARHGIKRADGNERHGRLDADFAG